MSDKLLREALANLLAIVERCGVDRMWGAVPVHLGALEVRAKTQEAIEGARAALSASPEAGQTVGLPEGCPAEAVFSEATGGIYSLPMPENMRTHTVEIHPVGTRARLAAVWHPMETAPRDGTWVLGLFGGDMNGESVYAVTHFTNGSWRDDRNGSELMEPEFWMPLPSAPSQEGNA